ncbi:MAG: Calx-beta domain-containing protein [Pyrinomonadaceae bacterium]
MLRIPSRVRTFIRVPFIFLGLVAITFAGVFTFAPIASKLVGGVKSSAQAKSIASPLGSGCATSGPVEIVSTGGTTTPTAYANLGGAFAAINAGTHTGTIDIGICGDTTETATASLDASGSGSTSYTSVHIAPIDLSRTISGNFTGAIIKLNGADNVTIDGRLGGTGNGRNLTVSNGSSATGSAIFWLSSLAADAGATNNTIRNVKMSAGPTNTNTSSTFGIILSGTSISTTSNGADNDNNQLLENEITSVRYGIVTRGVTTNNNLGIVIKDNVIGPENLGDAVISRTGILLQADTGAIVSGNTVRFVGGDLANSTSGSDRTGIGVGTDSWSATSSTTITSGDYVVTGNIIHDVIEERTFSAAGIVVGTTRSGSPTNNLIANNMVYNVRANGTSGDQPVGIGVSGGHTDKIVFNSISMTGDMDPGTATAASTFGNAIRIPGANATNNANFTVASNSIYLDASSSSTSANRYYAITLNNAGYSFGSGFLNNNNYYINTSNSQVQTGGLATASGNATTTQFAALADWQTALTTAQDANSIQSDPGYTDPIADLHISVASPNNDAGVAITGVDTDIDDELRVDTPDIGADEADGVVPAANDISALSIVNPADGSTRGANVAFSPSASFKNIGTNPQTSVTVRFKITDSGSAEVYNQTETIPSIAAGEIVTVSFPSTTLPNPGLYTTEASSELSGDETPANDSTSGSFSQELPLAGTVAVGSGEALTSLTNPGGLFDKLNSIGATADVVVQITSDLTAETGNIQLNEIAGGFTLTISPSGAARTISGSSNDALIALNGADGVTIDGLLPTSTLQGGNDSARSLDIINTSTTATGGAVIAIKSGLNGAQNNALRNLRVSGQDPSQTLIGISVGGNTPGTAGNGNNSNEIFNCSIRKAIYGVYMAGNIATPDTNNTVSANDLTGTGAERIKRIGMLFFNQDGVVVLDNDIGGISTDESIDAIGIALGTQNITNSTLTIGGISNALVARNRVNGVAATSTVGFSAAGIVLAPVAAENVIKNNMISGVIAPSTSPDMPVGIFVVGTTGSSTKIYHNSVALTGDRGTGTTLTPGFGIAVTGTDPPVDLKDNIFYNSQTSASTNGKAYALGLTSATFAGITSDFNNFFSTGTSAGGFRSGSLGGGSGTDYADITAWRTASSLDASSPEGDPLFVDPATDLHITPTSPSENSGTFIASVTDDFDGEVRASKGPEIGADELTPPVPGSLQLTSTSYAISEGGANATITVTRTDGSDGSVSVDYATSNGTATAGTCGAGGDYTAVTGTLTWADGDAADKTFTVPICEDTVFEGDETFGVALSNSTGGATIGTPASATVTIVENDSPVPGSIQLSSASYAIGEGGGSATITVTRTGGSDGAVSVDYGTSNGTASSGTCGAGGDYTGVSGTLTWANGDSADKTFNVPICEDTIFEGDETFGLALSNATGGATIGTPATANVTIVDNDTAANGTLELSSATYSDAEGTTAIITVMRTGGSDGAVSVDYASSNGTASAGTCGAGGDYEGTTGTLNWADGDSASKTFSVILCEDAVSESDETVNLALSNATGGATIGTNATAVLTITDVAAPPVHEFDDAAYIDDESQSAIVTVTRTGDTSVASTVDFAMASGTATVGASCAPGTDAVDVSGTLNFAADELSKDVEIVLCSDTAIEGPETIALSLSNPTGGTLGTVTSATLTVNDTANQFVNMTPIAVPGTGTGSSTPPNSPANPYPATITVGDSTGTISHVRVTLYDVQHTFADDIDVLLVGPGGQTFVLMADAGGATGTDEMTTITLDSDVAGVLPNSGVIASGSYQPANFSTPVGNFPAPAPAGPYNEPGTVPAPPGSPTLNSVYNGTGASGDWSLYIRDDASGDTGTIAGWGIEFQGPTFADATISGRLTDSVGSGMPNAFVTISGGALPGPITVRTNSFGYYQIRNIPVGMTYIVSPSFRDTVFDPSDSVVTVNSSITGLNFSEAPAP